MRPGAICRLPSAEMSRGHWIATGRAWSVGAASSRALIVTLVGIQSVERRNAPAPALALLL